MAKKFWAYAKKNDSFIQEKGRDRKRLFLIWEVLKLKKASKDPHYARTLDELPEYNFNELDFWSTQNIDNSRKKLSPVTTGFFRYNPGEAPSSQGGDGESLSHQIAILALSRIKSIPFYISDKKLELMFVDFDIDGEETKLQFGGGKYHYPDLIGYLDKNSDNYSKWGGKVAIEVKVTHGYKADDPRIKLFKRHNVAVLQVTITDAIRFWPELKKKPSAVTAESIEEYFNYLVGVFSQKTYATILSDPLDTDYAIEKINASKMESKNLTVKLDEAQTKCDNTVHELSTFKREVERVREEKKEILVNAEREAEKNQKEHERVKLITNLQLWGLYGIVLGAIIFSFIFPDSAVAGLNKYFSFIDICLQNLIKVFKFFGFF